MPADDYRDRHGRILPGLTPGWAMSWWTHEQGITPAAIAAMTAQQRADTITRYWQAVGDGWQPPVTDADLVGPHAPFDHAVHEPPLGPDADDEDLPIPPQAVAAASAWLTGQLGAQLVAYATDATAEAVTAWAAGNAVPAARQLARLSWTLAATRLLVTRLGPVTARSWLLGENPELDGRAPARVLRHGRTDSVWRTVLDAATTYVAP